MTSPFQRDSPGVPAGEVIALTDAAREFVAQARSGEADGDRLALYVEVSGTNQGSYTYDMWFEALSDAAPGDAVVSRGGLSVVVLESSVDRLRGATLDVQGGAEGPGLVMLNPNTPPPAPGSRPAPKGDLSSPLARRVAEVISSEINPQIAMHGGRADLVAVDEGVAYVRLSGGCQGCGLAAVTLSQGISVAIRDAVPEITEVVDVTAHEEGSDPYFQAAKK